MKLKKEYEEKQAYGKSSRINHGQEFAKKR